jgi:hypothetical protein
MYQPKFAEFEAFARRGNLIPVYRFKKAAAEGSRLSTGKRRRRREVGAVFLYWHGCGCCIQGPRPERDH